MGTRICAVPSTYDLRLNIKGQIRRGVCGGDLLLVSRCPEWSFKCRHEKHRRRHCLIFAGHRRRLLTKTAQLVRAIGPFGVLEGFRPAFHDMVARPRYVAYSSASDTALLVSKRHLDFGSSPPIASCHASNIGKEYEWLLAHIRPDNRINTVFN